MSDPIRREDALRVTLAYSSSYSAEQAETAIRALPAVQPDADELVGHMTKLIAAGLDRVEALTAERDRLREALDGLLASVEHVDFAEGWCCCGDDMPHHSGPMDCGHTPVDVGEYHASLAIKEARAALKGETQ